MSRDITKANKTLQEFFPVLKAKYEALHPGTELFITHVDRTPVEQLLLFVQGRLPSYPGPIVTWKDGFMSKSRHNDLPLSGAIDVAVKVNGVVSWNLCYVIKIGALLADSPFADRIRWGGTFSDYYHFEIKR